MPGMRLGSYTTVRKLGSGGMGEVYLAQHRHLARRAAIKVLRPELSRREEILARFFTEARATSLARATRRSSRSSTATCCPAARRTSSWSTWSARRSARRWPGRGTSRATSAGSRPSPARWPSALAAAHASGIVHRDLKPDNIFLAVGRAYPSAVDVKVLDFGIAKLVDDERGTPSHTRTGSLLGTPVYMSPEQCRGARQVDHRSDIYSLGCVMFELLCGQPPFLREGTGDLLVAHISEPPPPVSALRPDVAPVLADLVASMLLKDPTRRLQSMAEVVAAIERFLRVPAAQLGSLVTPPTGFPDAPEPLVPMPAASSAAATAIAPPPPGATPGGTLPLEPRSSPRPSPAPASNTTLTSSARAVDFEPRPAERRRHGRWLLRLAALGVAGGLAAAVYLGVSRVGHRSPLRATDDAVVARAPVLPAVPAPPARPAVEPESAAIADHVALEIGSNPSGAAVYFDDEAAPRATTPAHLRLPRGTGAWSVRLKARGFADETRSVDRSRDTSLTVELRPIEAAPLRPGKKDKPEKKASRSRSAEEIPEPNPYRPVGD